VLAVDDDEDLLVMLEIIFTRGSCRFLVATDGASALELVDSDKPDVVLLDLMMPKMDGFTFLQQLRRRVRSPRVVCLTAKGSALDRRRAWRLGIDEYVTKPFAVEGLVEAVAAVVGRSWPERRARRQRALEVLKEFHGAGE
jgi:DNA-binding response OmpR family regulator